MKAYQHVINIFLKSISTKASSPPNKLTKYLIVENKYNTKYTVTNLASHLILFIKTIIEALHIRYAKYNQYVLGCPAASQYARSVHNTKLFKISLEIQKNNNG
jgi:hypothetical protein